MKARQTVAVPDYTTTSALLLTSQAARLLAVSSETVRLWERTGQLRAVRVVGGLRLFQRVDVERLAREREALRAAAVQSNVGHEDQR